MATTATSPLICSQPDSPNARASHGRPHVMALFKTHPNKSTRGWRDSNASRMFLRPAGPATGKPANLRPRLRWRRFFASET